MPITLLDVPIEAISIDPDRFPDRDQSHIFEHLLHYCSKFDPLPAITMEIRDGVAFVVRGHKYVRAARALGRPSIRAVLASSPSAPDAVEWMERSDVRGLDWEQIRAAEDRDRTPRGWHVFFFERALTFDERRGFDERVARLFGAVDGASAIRVHHDDAKRLAEFEAPTPVTDHAWATEHLVTFSEFSRERARIVSYQGRRFPEIFGSGV